MSLINTSVPISSVVVNSVVVPITETSTNTNNEN